MIFASARKGLAELQEDQIQGTCDSVWPGLKVPVRSNFTNFMFLHFSKVYVVVTYHAKPFFNQSTGSPFFSTVFLAISCPPLIGHVPTAH